MKCYCSSDPVLFPMVYGKKYNFKSNYSAYAPSFYARLETEV